MKKFLNQVWAAFASSVKGFDSPSQLAIGLTFGMVIGMIPKDSLFPYTILVVALLTNANLLTLILSTITFSWISPLLDPLTHKIGLWVLTFDPFEAFWVQCYQLPIVPWTRLENTVVMGSLALGLLVALPVFAISYQLFERFGESIFNLVLENRLARWLLGAPTPKFQES